MPRAARIAPGGYVFHVLNRANGRLPLFKKDGDFLAFEKLLVEAHQRVPIGILDWCLMPNHWHLVLRPREDGELTDFMRWLSLTHAQRWKTAHDAIGHGHLYQGRFKSFIIQEDEHLATVLRYVHRNPLRAKLVKRAQDWRWGSCHVRLRGPDELKGLLSDWPIDLPRDWVGWVNAAQTETEVELIRTSIKRDRPFGGKVWTTRTVSRLGLEKTMRPRGRPLGWRKRKGGK